MTRSLALVHTVAGLVPTFGELLERHLADWTAFNMVDESLLRNAIRDGGLTHVTMRRLMNHVWSAVDSGADAVFVTCSSMGSAVEAARPFCPVPLVRVDEGMADRAIELGKRIGVLATLSTTMEPTCDLLKARAARAGRQVTVVRHLCDGAFDALLAQNVARHDALVSEGLRSLERKVDVVLLAQASMTRVLEAGTGAKPGVPVLSSPELGIVHLKSQLP